MNRPGDRAGTDNNADPNGALRLNSAGTYDLVRQGVRLEEELPLIVRDEELEADGVARYSTSERIWVAAIDWQRIRQRSA